MRQIRSPIGWNESWGNVNLIPMFHHKVARKYCSSNSEIISPYKIPSPPPPKRYQKMAKGLYFNRQWEWVRKCKRHYVIRKLLLFRENVNSWHCLSMGDLVFPLSMQIQAQKEAANSLLASLCLILLLGYTPSVFNAACGQIFYPHELFFLLFQKSQPFSLYHIKNRASKILVGER